MVNEPSVFEPLKFDCSFSIIEMHTVDLILYFSCRQDDDLMGSSFNNTDSSIPGTTRYYAFLYVFKFYNSDDIFFACDVTVCPSGSSSCNIVSKLTNAT